MMYSMCLECVAGKSVETATYICGEYVMCVRVGVARPSILS